METADVLFGKNLKYLREISGLSLTKMAKMAGMSFKTLKTIENGGFAGHICLSQLKILEKNLGVSPSVMVGDRQDLIKQMYEKKMSES